MDMTNFDYFTCGAQCGFPSGAAGMLYDCFNTYCYNQCFGP
jgi:hypothetical protein